jgi:UDP-N-acetylglucosamine acyltransferase
MAMIHPSALIDPQAEIDTSVEVGPFAVIGPNVQIGPSCVVHAFAQVTGRTRLGRANTIHSHCVIGGPPQDKKYQGEPTGLEIGDGNTFRECCTVNIGTVQDAGVTRIGSDNWIMAYVHIAHDCQIGSHTIMANATQLAGHVVVGDWAILGGLTGVHQFVRIGAHAMTGAGTTLLQDLPPYVIATGNPAAAHGINAEGLKRRGWSASQIALLRRAYKLVYKSGLTLAESLAALQDANAIGTAEAQDRAMLGPLIDFLAASGRGIVR